MCMPASDPASTPYVQALCLCCILHQPAVSVADAQVWSLPLGWQRSRDVQGEGGAGSSLEVLTVSSHTAVAFVCVASGMLLVMFFFLSKAFFYVLVRPHLGSCGTCCVAHAAGMAPGGVRLPEALCCIKGLLGTAVASGSQQACARQLVPCTWLAPEPASTVSVGRESHQDCCSAPSFNRWHSARTEHRCAQVAMFCLGSCQALATAFSSLLEQLAPPKLQQHCTRLPLLGPVSTLTLAGT